MLNQETKDKIFTAYKENMEDLIRKQLSSLVDTAVECLSVAISSALYTSVCDKVYDMSIDTLYESIYDSMYEDVFSDACDAVADSLYSQNHETLKKIDENLKIATEALAGIFS